MGFALPRRLSAAIVALLTGVSAGLAPGAVSASRSIDWVQFHFSPDLSGYNKFESVLRPDNVGGLVLKWQTHIGGEIQPDISSTPILADGRVYVASMGGPICFPGCDSEEAYLFSLRADNGKAIWRQPLGTDQVRSTAVLSDGIVYIGAGGAVRAFRADTGASIWSTPLGGQPGSSATLSRGLIYTGASDGKVYSISAADGSIKWSAQTGGEISSPIAAAGNRVYTGSSDGSLYAFDARTGALAWRRGHSIGQGGAAVVDGKVYVVETNIQSGDTLEDVLEARSASNGSLIWTAPATLDVHSTPVVGAGLVILGAVNGPEMRAYDASSGRERWSAPVGDGAEVLGSPVLANGVAYVVTDDATLHAVNSKTGAELFSWTAPPMSNATTNTPVVVNGMVYAGFGDGEVRSFGLP
jgi:outer membrane protein assembly factor BamB